MNKQGIFTQLEKQKGSPLTENEIDKVLEHLEIPQNTNGNYIDAFNKDISYNGIKTLKRPYTQLSLTPDHLNELEVCRNDIFYFVRYYCKILTKNGITRPEIRDYQNEFLGMLSSGDDIIASLPRQSGKSVTSGLYLLWIANFTPNINIGIAGNKLDLAMEVLDKIKKIFIELPMWMKQGIEAWNKTYIQFENGTRILTSATSGDSFRGYSCIGGNEIIQVFDISKNKETSITLKELYSKCNFTPDISYNTQYKVKTTQGYKHFQGIIKSKHTEGFKVTLQNNVTFTATATHRVKVSKNIFRQIGNIEVGHRIQKHKVIAKEKVSDLEFFDFFNVDGNHTYLHKGLIHHNCHLLLIDEVAFVTSDKWTALEDSVFPAQDALSKKQKILISTPNGMNHWYHLVTGASNNKNGYRYFSTDWKKIPRYNRDGTQKDPNVFKDEIIRKHGKRYFAQNYELEFLGSSNTLISSYALKNLEPCDEKLVSYNTLFDGLRIFEEPIKNNHYIVGVDPNKCGIDNLAIQVLNVTELPFKQVASYNSNISYLNAPSKIFDLGRHYNNAMIIVENNIDNSIVDTLYYQYEYDGEIYKEKNKNILGFRTTKKSKKILLSILKKLIEENKLIIKDKKTIDELFVFVEQQNGSFSAQDGFKDDLVMALCVCLAPFIEIKDFEDFQTFLKFIETENELLEKEQNQMRELFVGFSFSTEITDEDIDMLSKETLSFDY